MGMFAEVAGWLSLDEERLAKALEIIKADLDGVGHCGDSRCVQTQGGGYSRHLFFGCSVRESEGTPTELWQISGGVLRVEKGG